MKEQSEYRIALGNFVRDREKIVFKNKNIQGAIEIIDAMCEGSKKDLFIYELNLNSYIHNNTEYIDALKKILKKSKTIFIVVNEERCSDEILKLQKSYGSSIVIKKANDVFVSFLSNLLKDKEKAFVENFYYTEDMYRICTRDFEHKHYSSINCFNDSEIRETLETIFHKYFQDLALANFLN